MLTTKCKIGLLTILFLTVFLFNKTALTEAENVILLDNYNGFLTNVGYYVYAEIQNNGNSAVKDVVLNIKFSLTTGEEITNTTSSVLPIILKGRRSPVIFLQYNISLSAKVSGFSISLKDYETTQACSTYLRIGASLPTNDSILGTIENGASEDMPSTSIYGTFYDENHTVLAVNSEHVWMESGGKQTFMIKYPFEFGVENVIWYSLTAYSPHPESTVQEEVDFAAFKEENEGLSPILTLFIVLVAFSALVLAGAYAITKIKHRKTRKRRRTSPKTGTRS